MSTSGSGGKTLKKKVTVMTDAPKNGDIPLTIKGQVIELYTLSPKSVKLKGIVGEPLKETISLFPNKAYAFTLKEITAKRGENIRFQLEEIREDDAVRYAVTVENTRTEAGVYFDTLYLKTDSDKKPEIQINVFGSISEPPEPATKNQEG